MSSSLAQPPQVRISLYHIFTLLPTPSTIPYTISRIRIHIHNSQLRRPLIVPLRIIQTPRRLPRPKRLTRHLLIRHHLRHPPLLIPLPNHAWITFVRPLHSRISTRGPLPTIVG
jgi:hypothetical protein